MKNSTYLVDAIVVTPKQQPVALTKVSKGHYAPTPVAVLEKEGLVNPSLSELEKVFPDARIFELQKCKSDRKLRKCVQESGRNEIQQAFELIGTIDQLLEEGKLAVQTLLLGLLSRMMDAAFTFLPGAPIVTLSGLPQIPATLNLLLALTQGQHELSGSKWKLKRPHSIASKVPIGGNTPTSDVETYIGGHYKSKKFWVPYQNGSVAIAANVPQEVFEAIITSSPFMIPFLCSMPSKKIMKDSTRPLLKYNGDAYFMFDQDMLGQLCASSHVISGMFEAFLEWFRKKGKRIRAWSDDIDTFRPVIRQGKYTQRVMDNDVGYYAAMLSLWNQFLLFASREKNWITEEQASESLHRYWRLILPESAPANEIMVDGQPIAGRWDQPEVFWTFLIHYLTENKSNLVGFNRPRNKKTVGILHRLSNQDYLVFPRKRLTDAYLDCLSEIGHATDCPEEFDIALQKKIMSWSIQLKNEGKDITWRYSFYPENDVPNGQKSKLPCLAFPVLQLPAEVTDVLNTVFGTAFGGCNIGNQTRTETEQGKVLGKRFPEEK